MLKEVLLLEKAVLQVVLVLMPRVQQPQHQALLHMLKVEVLQLKVTILMLRAIIQLHLVHFMVHNMYKVGIMQKILLIDMQTQQAEELLVQLERTFLLLQKLVISILNRIFTSSQMMMAKMAINCHIQQKKLQAMVLRHQTQLRGTMFTFILEKLQA